MGSGGTLAPWPPIVCSGQQGLPGRDRVRDEAASEPKRCAFGMAVLEYGVTEPVKPHGPLVQLGSTGCPASTCCLSTWWSSTALLLLEAEGGLILGRASHLDAFSGSPVPTWLPGTAAGATTGTPEVGPSRSSRTKDGIPQSSNAHDGYRPNCLTTF